MPQPLYDVSVANYLQLLDAMFNARGMERLFTSEGFVASFSMPNFFFHVTTADNILRSKGVPVGKSDFVGQLRLKG